MLRHATSLGGHLSHLNPLPQLPSRISAHASLRLSSLLQQHTPAARALSSSSTTDEDSNVSARSQPRLLSRLWRLLEGNVLNITHLKRGTKVGEDEHGNEYFENYDYPHLQQRWVKFKDEYSYNATQIPPEWHAWMHYLGDYAPHNTEMYEAKYKLPTDSEGTNKTGTPRQYFNKGNWANPNSKPGAWGSRSWKKYESFLDKQN